MAKADAKVRSMLSDLCQALDRELVVFFDEADSLREAPLLMFLRQIRTGYNRRSDFPGSRFPRSMALAGRSDIRDCLTEIRPDGESKGHGGSPFDVRKKPLSLEDFTRVEIGTLYAQHTAETGQLFEPEAVDRAWHWTEGQPWLVNALAEDIVVKRFKNDYARAVTGADVDAAARDIILHSEPQFFSLKERLREPRVRRVVESVLVGTVSLPTAISNYDAQYAVDLGLLKVDTENGDPKRPANPIYSEIIARTLTEKLQEMMPEELTGKWMDGTRLDMNGLLKEFQKYWRKNRKSLAVENEIDSRICESVNVALARFNIADGGVDDALARTIRKSLTDRSTEAFCLLVPFAFLQRVVNGVAEIDRHYALGKTRVDIFVQYKGIAYPLELNIKGNRSRKKKKKAWRS
jgi:hypothetical protein